MESPRRSASGSAVCRARFIDWTTRCGRSPPSTRKSAVASAWIWPTSARTGSADPPSGASSRTGLAWRITNNSTTREATGEPLAGLPPTLAADRTLADGVKSRQPLDRTLTGTCRPRADSADSVEPIIFLPVKGVSKCVGSLTSKGARCVVHPVQKCLGCWSAQLLASSRRTSPRDLPSWRGSCWWRQRWCAVAPTRTAGSLSDSLSDSPSSWRWPSRAI